MTYSIRLNNKENVVSTSESMTEAFRVARTSGVPAWVHDSADDSFVEFNQPAKKIAKADRAPKSYPSNRAAKSAKPARKSAQRASRNVGYIGSDAETTQRLLDK